MAGFNFSFSCIFTRPLNSKVELGYFICCNTSCNMIKIFYSKYTVACLPRVNSLTLLRDQKERHVNVNDNNNSPRNVHTSQVSFSSHVLSSLFGKISQAWPSSHRISLVCLSNLTNDREERAELCVWNGPAGQSDDGGGDSVKHVSPQCRRLPVWCHTERLNLWNSSVIQEEVVSALLLFHVLENENRKRF